MSNDSVSIILAIFSFVVISVLQVACTDVMMSLGQTIVELVSLLFLGFHELPLFGTAFLVPTPTSSYLISLYREILWKAGAKYTGQWTMPTVILVQRVKRASMAFIRIVGDLEQTLISGRTPYLLYKREGNPFGV